ncbi:MAG: squalene monooxygenase [Bacteroidota bacterium]|nr:squalene monooxygenase [Bacteroidota bacterium]
MDTVKGFDVCIIGAGVAGGAMAAYLGKSGLKVAVVEKSLAEHDRIIGELLQPGGVIKLKEMGLGHLLDDFDAQEIQGYGLFMNGDCFRISYPEQDGHAISGRGFRNGKFVQKIRQYIIGLPGVTVFEGSANELIEENGRVSGVKYTSKQDDQVHVIEAGLTVVCDGMFSIFRKKLSSGDKKISSYFLGMVLKNCDLPFKNHGHVIVARPSPCLVYPISSDETRMLIDFPGNEAPRKSPELIAYLKNEIAPQLPVQILPSFLAAVAEAKFKVMPNHLIPAKPFVKNGVVMVGDSLNMRHPLTGAGMTAAFTDIYNVGTRLIAIEDFSNTAAIDESVRMFYNSRHKQNATINILADALYGVMQNEDLSVACYDYLKRGGNYAQQPVAILSAVSRNVKMLLRHFFAVALYGVSNIIKPFPTIPRLKRSYNMLKSAVQIVSPLVMNERPGFVVRYAFRIAGALF